MTPLLIAKCPPGYNDPIVTTFLKTYGLHLVFVIDDMRYMNLTMLDNKTGAEWFFVPSSTPVEIFRGEFKQGVATHIDPEQFRIRNKMICHMWSNDVENVIQTRRLDKQVESCMRTLFFELKLKLNRANRYTLIQTNHDGYITDIRSIAAFAQTDSTENRVFNLALAGVDVADIEDDMNAEEIETIMEFRDELDVETTAEDDFTSLMHSAMNSNLREGKFRI